MTNYEEKYKAIVDKLILLNNEYHLKMEEIANNAFDSSNINSVNYMENKEYSKYMSKMEVIHELMEDTNIDCIECNTGFWSENDGYILLQDSSNGDSRTSKKNPSMEEIREAVEIHIDDVDKALSFWIKLLNERKGKHDWTKLENFENEYGFLVHNGVKDKVFLKSEWWHKHITKERHHLQYYSPIDVNLIDVFELISDRVVAEKGRTGKIIKEYLEIDTAILKDAYWNTVKLLDDKTRRIK